jgi:hypothetical protein
MPDRRAISDCDKPLARSLWIRSVVSLMPQLYAMSHSMSMPRRIIRGCIVPAVKPYQLIAALMARAKLGSLPLAKKMNRPELQSQIYRFSHGDVASPERTTAAPLAEFFGLPIDAIYDEKLATAIAKERGITALPTPEPKPRKKGAAQRLDGLSAEAVKFAREYEKLDPAERQRLRLLMLAARNGTNPTGIKPAPWREREAPADSGLGELDDKPARRSHHRKP